MVSGTAVSVHHGCVVCLQKVTCVYPQCSGVRGTTHVSATSTCVTVCLTVAITRMNSTVSIRSQICLVSSCMLY